MKKPYQKPILVTESFQLDAAIAGGCGAALNQAEDTCGYGKIEENWWTYFGIDTCEINVTNPLTGQYDGFCYQGPPDGSVFLTS